MKVLRVTMPDGSKWDVPADTVARSRAKYYADKEGKLDDTPWQMRFDKEYDYAFNEPSELIDWAKNNMNWSDVEMHAKRVATADDVNFQDGWTNGEMKVLN